MASKLKFNDPHYAHSEGDIYDLGDPQWIVSLSFISQAYKVIGRFFFFFIDSFPPPPRQKTRMDKFNSRLFQVGTIQHVVDNEVGGSMSSLPTNEYEAREGLNNLVNNRYPSNSQNVAYQNDCVGYGADQQIVTDADQAEQYARIQHGRLPQEGVEQAHNQGFPSANVNVQNNHVTNGEFFFT